MVGQKGANELDFSTVKESDKHHYLREEDVPLLASPDIHAKYTTEVVIEEGKNITCPEKDDNKLLSKTKSIKQARVAISAYIILEKVAYSAFNAILTQYLLEMLSLTTAQSSAFMSVLNLLVYACVACGAVVCDAWCGKWMLFMFSALAHIIGLMLALLSSTPPAWDVYPTTPSSIGMGLFIIACLLIALGNTAKMPLYGMLVEHVSIGKEGCPEIGETVWIVVASFINCAAIIGTYVGPVLHTFGEQKSYGSRLIGTSYYLSFAFLVVTYIAAFAWFCSSRKSYINIGRPKKRCPNAQREEGPRIVPVFEDVWAAIKDGWVNSRKQLSQTGNQTFVKQHFSTLSFLSCCSERYKRVAHDIQSIVHIVLFNLTFGAIYFLFDSQVVNATVFQGMWMEYPTFFQPSSTQVITCTFGIISRYLLVLFLDFLRTNRFYRVYLGPFQRISISFVFLSAACAYTAVLQSYINKNGIVCDGVFRSSLSIWWEIPGLLLEAASSSFGQLCLVEYSLGVAPDYMKTAITGAEGLAYAVNYAISVFVAPLMCVEYLQLAFTAYSIISFLIAIFIWVTSLATRCTPRRWDFFDNISAHELFYRLQQRQRSSWLRKIKEYCKPTLEYLFR